MTEETDSNGAGTAKGFGVAYAYVNRRERTVAEVRARLERAEVRAQEIDEVVAELLEFGYLDDARYARVFTQDKRTLEAWGNERIARVLRERGVEAELIEAALSESEGQEWFGSPDGLAPWPAAGSTNSSAPPGPGGGFGETIAHSSEFDRALALLHQRFPGGPATPRDRERAFGVLARKGYESETSADVVREWARRSTV